VSSWEKPAASKPTESVVIKTESSATATGALETAWKEYIANDGSQRKYYYNVQTKQSVWEMPEEYKRRDDVWSISVLLIPCLLVVFLSAKNSGQNSHMEKQQENKQENRSKNKTADETFMALLDRFDISSTESWESALKKIIKEIDYACIRHVSDKKRLFLKYQEKRKGLELQRQQDARVQAVQTFTESLKKQKRIYFFSKYG
jgi:pre-mRNA-processing factor 40